jgi:hypothetical protein
VYLPPLAKPTGGLTVLHQVAAHLKASGFDVRLAPREMNIWLPDISIDVPRTAWDGLRLANDDIWLVPEGWTNALTPGLKAGARCVVYCQNWAYLFSSLPQGVSWRDLNVSFLAVSDPVALFIRETLGLDAPVLRPGIDLDVFAAPENKPQGMIRVAYMPRKNSALATRVRQTVQARMAVSGGPELVWEEIHGLPTEGVAEALKHSHIFLATGFPEGCPLPPLEAMACGCLVVGYAGFGGFDYMRNADGFDGYVPWWEQRETPWGGNGLYTADADVLGAALALETAARWVAEGGERYYTAIAQAQKTAQAYGLQTQREAVRAIWNQIIPIS